MTKWALFKQAGLAALLKSDYVKLAPILALGFYVAAIPHLGHPYRLHIDEWVHIAHSNAILSTGNIFYPDPFSGQGSSGVVGLLELGFHLPLAVFQSLSGVAWLDIVQYFPSVVFMVAIISVYIFASPMGFGWEAAFFASLLPTVVGILGPGFLVPVAVGLVFIPLLFFLIYSHRTVWSYITIGLLVSYLVILHAPSAILAIMAVAPFILLSLKDELKHGLAITLALGFPFLVTLPWTHDLIVSEASSLFVQKQIPPYHSFGQLIQGYGYMVAVLCLLGGFALAMKADKKSYGLILGLAALAVMVAVFSSFHYGVEMLYLRGLLFTTLLVGIVAGAGLKTLRTLDTGLVWGGWLAGLKSRNHLMAQGAGVLLCLIVVGVTLAIAIPDRQATPYYDMIDQQDYQAFVWIKDNLGANYDKVLLDPWKATAFNALTGKHVYARLHVNATDADKRVYDFLRNGSTDTALLKANGISVVYTRYWNQSNEINVEVGSANPNLIQVAKNVYLVKQ